MNYYTLQVHYSGLGHDQPQVQELKDMSPGEGMTDEAWINKLRERIFMTGIKVQTAPGTHEFISPFRINTCYLIKQDKKFSL